jgi:hypothetical protein
LPPGAPWPLVIGIQVFQQANAPPAHETFARPKRLMARPYIYA